MPHVGIGTVSLHFTGCTCLSVFDVAQHQETLVCASRPVKATCREGGGHQFPRTLRTKCCSAWQRGVDCRNEIDIVLPGRSQAEGSVDFLQLARAAGRLPPDRPDLEAQTLPAYRLDFFIFCWNLRFKIGSNSQFFFESLPTCVGRAGNVVHLSVRALQHGAHCT